MEFAPKATVLCEISRNNDNWAVQGHSLWPILVNNINLAYIISYTIPNYRGVIGQIIAFDTWCLSSFAVNSWTLD